MAVVRPFNSSCGTCTVACHTCLAAMQQQQVQQEVLVVVWLALSLQAPAVLPLQVAQPQQDTT